MNFHKATARYEAWLGRHVSILPEDLEIKHQAMRAARFPFLRATYYRWAQIFPEICGKFAEAPDVLGVGDLHVENFGTWRDIEGRLIWGINDFDEACVVPYTHDLVRLASSAAMAIEENHLRLNAAQAAAAILDGYTCSLQEGGRPFVLAENHPALRHMAVHRLRDPQAFWQKLDKLDTVTRGIPPSALRAISLLLPARDLEYRVVHRTAGLGSLGRQRFAAIADFCGGELAREAKALAPSACLWATHGRGSAKIHYQTLLDTAVRSCDPFVKLKGRWIVRRLAPDCSRIDMASLPEERDEIRLLRGMGFETANVHLGNTKARTILKHLGKLPDSWLQKAAAKMAAAVSADWEEWRKG
jgi:hypothetical protein